ncbi:MAG: serine/threonine-protein kinase [Phycisphaeraceae bacterium]
MSTDSTSPILGEPLETVTCACGTIVKVAGLPPLSKVECPKCGAMFPLPVKLGQFHLLKRLGQGSMGEVFEAKDITLGRHVAIKVMGRKIAADEEAMRGFVREARSLAALNHRNVVQVHTIGVEKRQPYIVMELVSGGRVDQMIEKDMPGDERRTLQIAIDAARGLEAAANAGMVHGDVKPANILLDANGQGKIVDFGLARLADTHEEGKIYGTPFYLPPELLKGKKADFRSDIFSLGASLFHVLVGRPPFRGKTVKDIVRARLVDSAPNLREVVPSIHPATANVIARMLARNPEDRHQSYEELVTELQGAVNTLNDPNMSGELADLTEAISGTERTAARTARVPVPEPGERSRSRINYVDGARTVARMSHGEIVAPEGGSKKLWIIGGATAAVVVIILIIVLASSGGDGGRGGGPDGGPGGGGNGAGLKTFTESFPGSTLDPAWTFVQGGGKLAEGRYRLTDSDVVNEPGIKRVIGNGSCDITFDVARFESAGRGEAFKFEVWDDAYRGVLLHLYNDQGSCYLEIRKADPTGGSVLLGKTKFEALPKSLKLRAEWDMPNGRWRIRYGIDGAPATTEAEGGRLDGFRSSEPPSGRFIQIRVDQFGNAGTSAMELSKVDVSPGQ